MKKLLIAALALLAGSLAAKAFEGTATYVMTGKDGRTVEMNFTLKDGKLRSESTHEGHTGISILDPAKKSILILMPERKAYMEQGFHGKSDKKGSGEGKMTKTGKSETIAGYKADEWLIENHGQSAHLWGTTELGQGMGTAMGGRPGDGAGLEVPAELRDKGFFVLRVEGDGKHGFGKMEATSVKPGPVDASLFSIPEGYQKLGMMGFGGESAMGGHPEAAEKMRKAMQNMTPEQRAAFDKMMQGHGAGQ